jgi:hypothetical protein
VQHEEELFGDSESLPDDEFEIVFSRMENKDKVAALKELRALKQQRLGVPNTTIC